LPKPQLRALAGVNIQNLEQLRNWKEKDIAALHGMGPKGIRILREALAAHGWTFAPAEFPEKDRQMTASTRYDQAT